MPVERTRLEDLTKGALVRGVLGDRAVRVVDVAWHGSNAVTLTYTDEPTGKVDQELLYRDDEPRLRVEEAGRAWSMDADGSLFRLVSEAKRISLAYLFDPFLAVQTSNLDPLPHQIDAVYDKMLPRQPLRFLLADDPGAGKTIMAGLFCKELMIRGDVERCLVVAPGSLVEQWQDELWQKFGLNFEILTRDMIEAARSGNPFAERPLLIARLDHLSRNEDLQAKLAGHRLGPGRRRRGAQDVGPLLRRRGQGDQALQARPAARLGRPALPAHDGHAARGHRRGLPALHGAARRRPLRGQAPRRHATPSTPRT